MLIHIVARALHQGAVDALFLALKSLDIAGRRTEPYHLFPLRSTG